MRNFKDITIKTRGFTLVELMMVMIIQLVLFLRFSNQMVARQWLLFVLVVFL